MTIETCYYFVVIILLTDTVNSVVMWYIFVFPLVLAQSAEYIWYSIPGNVQKLAANSQELWGLGTDSRLYHCMLPCDGQTNRWMPLQGTPRLKEIALSETEAWGLTPSGEIYRCSLPCEHQMDWARVSGILKHLHTSNREVIGTDPRGNVYKAILQSRRYYPNVRWHHLPGTQMKKISFRGESVWGLDFKKQVYRFEPHLRFWMQQPVQMQALSVGKDYLYGLQAGSKILMRCPLPCLDADWEGTSHKFERILASPNEASTIYAIAPGGKIFMGIAGE